VVVSRRPNVIPRGRYYRRGTMVERSVSTSACPDEATAAYFFLRPLCRAFDTIPAFDDIGLEAYRPRSAVQLEEQAASIAEHRTEFISTPKRSC